MSSCKLNTHIIHAKVQDNGSKHIITRNSYTHDETYTCMHSWLDLVSDKETFILRIKRIYKVLFLIDPKKSQIRL